MVATDLDGTLVRTDGTIDPRTRRALRAAERSGAMVVFVSGRPPRWMSPLAGLVDHNTVAICANGALVYDLRTERLLAGHLLDVPVLLDVAGRLQTVLPELTFAAEYGMDFATEPGYVHQWDVGLPDVRIGPWRQILDRPAAKLLAHHPTLHPDVLVRRAAEAVRGLAVVTCSSTFGLLEISAPGVSKATTLAELAAGQGIAPAEVLAFGDMPNDLPMLDWAGRSVAVANAHPDVLAAADEVTASNDRFGVALVLERLFAAHSPGTLPDTDETSADSAVA